MKVMTVIVDDESLARTLLKEYLASYEEIEVVGECGDGETAVKLINEVRPDLIFLDVQMPRLNGFEVIENLTEIPIVIFSTAYEQYALQAFEVSAMDYLLKPYDRERFDKAMQRCLKALAHSEVDTGRMIRLMEEIHKERTYPKILFLKLRGKVIPVNVSEVEWIQAQGDYAEIHTAQGSFLSGHHLAHMESLLDPKLFVRIHRSSIVNVTFIREMDRTETGSYSIRLDSGKVLPVGRTRIDQLKDWMV